MTDDPGSGRRATGSPPASAGADVLELDVDDPQAPAVGSTRLRVGDSEVRGILAAAMTVLFALTVLAALATAIFGSKRADTQVVDILRDILPAELAILGSALGFYFGGR
jgi:hypothetical protein